MHTAKIDWIKQDCVDYNWRRVLVRGGGDFAHQVEILLTPSTWNPEGWELVNSVYIIRTDMRDARPDDYSVWSHHVPEVIFGHMYEFLGIGRTDFLMNADIYSLIDWNKFAQNDNNGCSLANCMKDFAWHFETVHSDKKGIASLRISEKDFVQRYAIFPLPNHMMIGGMLIENLKNTLLIYGYYDVVTGYVCFETSYVEEGKDIQTNRFNQRLKRHWQQDLIAYIEELACRKQITPESEDAVVNMINTAATTLMAFCIE